MDILYPGAFEQFQLPEGKVEEDILSFERRVGKERLRLSFYQHILPMTIGDSGDTVLKADFLQRKGFYALPVRPPTVPEGTSRIRFSLTADITEEEIKSLIELI